MQAGVVWLAPTILIGILLFQASRTNDVKTKLTKCAYAAVLLLGVVFFQNITAKLLPTLIQLFLMQFFYKTLIKGPPLIERFVRLEFEELPPDIVVYCRQLTVLWTGFFGFNAFICSALAIWGSPEWWAIYSGVIIFILTALLMVGEYVYRHFRFPDLEFPDLKASARNMLLYSRKILADVHAS